MISSFLASSQPALMNCLFCEQKQTFKWITTSSGRVIVSDSEGGRSVNMRIVGYKRLTFKILGAAHETSCDLLNRLHGGKFAFQQEGKTRSFVHVSKIMYSSEYYSVLTQNLQVPATNSKMKMDFLCQQYSSLCSLEIIPKATYQNVHEASEEKYKGCPVLFIFPSTLTSPVVTAEGKYSHSIVMLPPLCTTVGYVSSV
ncbi:hypothetical protein ILYODFUR_009117 [Ilyodon furcidens]|uniref:Uncharacterized protein n=1 Tax=Ilyodon furcidens TaxID=33524 RepID=A0ABV0VCV0_9TELE